MTIKAFDLTGKSGIVTGASRGIGLAMARGLAEAGAEVVIAGRSAEALESEAAAMRADGLKAMAVAVDMMSLDSIRALAEKTIAEFGKIDFLFNNAGVIHRTPCEDFPLDDFAIDLQTNLTGPFYLSQLAAKNMIADKRPGRIVNTSSLIAFQGGRTVPGYAASKAGLTQITKTMCNDWAQYGILVNAIAPGWVQTDMTKALRENPERFEGINSRIPLGRWAQPTDFAGIAVFLASDASAYITGVVIPVDGGWLAF